MLRAANEGMLMAFQWGHLLATGHWGWQWGAPLGCLPFNPMGEEPDLKDQLYSTGIQAPLTRIRLRIIDAPASKLKPGYPAPPSLTSIPAGR